MSNKIAKVKKKVKVSDLAYWGKKESWRLLKLETARSAAFPDIVL